MYTQPQRTQMGVQTTTPPASPYTKPQGTQTADKANPYLDNVTPPKMQGASWLGVDPKTTMSTSLAREGLQGYLGGDITPYMGQVTTILRQNGYDDPTFQRELTGAQYNALLQEGARLTGNTFTPYSTTGGGGAGTTPTPTGQPPAPEAPPELVLPEYQRREDFRFDPQDVLRDPGYQFEFDEGMKALTNSAAARGGVRGTNTMRDMVRFGQGLAATGLDRAYNRAAGTYDRNVAGDRYGYEADINRRQVQYAPQLLNWERNRDERRRDHEMQFEDAWRREQYGREDAWRRHAYQNDDLWRRYQLEENRRLRLADGGRL